jgi:hypothetical protein
MNHNNFVILHSADDAPKFLAKMSPVVTEENKQVVLEATISGSNLKVEWTKDGQPVSPSDVLKLLKKGDVYSLSLENTTAKDSGEYTCTASNESGAIFCLVTVQVLGEYPSFVWKSNP